MGAGCAAGTASTCTRRAYASSFRAGGHHLAHGHRHSHRPCILFQELARAAVVGCRCHVALCVAAGAGLGIGLLGLSLPAAVLLGAALAPTDPVLASDVQVGAPGERRKFETKFALTAEAGLNDGMAFPFTWLAVALAGVSAVSTSDAIPVLGTWLAYDVLYRIGAGLAIGYVLGRGAGYLVLRVSDKLGLVQKTDGFLALSLTLLVYGVTELAHGYGFIAVFVAALTFRHFEKQHEFHTELHDFTDQTERIFIAVLLLLFGGALVSGLLDALTWRVVAFSLLFLLVVRPVAAFISLLPVKADLREKLAISFFGIRGMGTIFYLSFALREAKFSAADDLWAAAGFTILLSILLHGFTATRVMRHLKRTLPVEEIPE